MSGEEHAVDASVGSPFEQAASLHLVEQLTDVALGHQKGIGEVLLADALARADARQYVELGRADAVRAYVVARGAVHTLEHPHQAQPGQQAGILSPRASVHCRAAEHTGVVARRGHGRGTNRPWPRSGSANGPTSSTPRRILARRTCP